MVIHQVLSQLTTELLTLHCTTWLAPWHHKVITHISCNDCHMKGVWYPVSTHKQVVNLIATTLSPTSTTGRGEYWSVLCVL